MPSTHQATSSSRAPRGGAGVDIVAIDGDSGRLPRDWARNTAGAAAHALLTRLGTLQGISLTIHKGMPLASGIGSSGASAVAAVVAVNELLGRPAGMEVLFACAMAGEVAGCGAAHPDNVAPSLYGGFILARSAEPPDLIRLPVPDGLSCALLHPHFEVDTGAARAMLGDTVALGAAVRQWGNMGALVAGLFRNDLRCWSRPRGSHRRAQAGGAGAGSRTGQKGGDARGCARMQLVGRRAVDFCVAPNTRRSPGRRRGDARRVSRDDSCRGRSVGFSGWRSGRADCGWAMKFISTRGGASSVDFRTALFAGLAPDGGLYVPGELAPLPLDALTNGGIASYFVGDELPRATVESLLAASLTFPMPLKAVDAGVFALELFHGPTFAFKDVGARVMARLMSAFHAAGEALTVLVATSGDTGSAVAHAFHGVEGTRVVVLFPEGQVSRVQEAQFTTLGDNVTAVAVNGAFDDCQRLAKQAFADTALRSRARLTSANSINIGRLVPQMFYYLHAALAHPGAVFSVPSGNFGNLTAGLMAKRLGAPIGGFIAATTVNDTLPRFLETGRYEPRASVTTLANAMDVGDPSNVERIRWFFGNDVDAMRQAITPSVHHDAEVRGAIGELWSRYGYLADPHTAIAYLGAKRAADTRPVIFLATAHPAKFREVVEPIIGRKVPLPPALAEALARPRRVERIAARLDELTALL